MIVVDIKISRRTPCLRSVPQEWARRQDPEVMSRSPNPAALPHKECGENIWSEPQLRPPCLSPKSMHYNNIKHPTTPICLNQQITASLPSLCPHTLGIPPTIFISLFLPLIWALLNFQPTSKLSSPVKQIQRNMRGHWMRNRLWDIFEMTLLSRRRRVWRRRRRRDMVWIIPVPTQILLYTFLILWL